MNDFLISPASHTYISQRLRLHYVDWGNPEAPPLLLLHGGRDHCRNWDWIAQELCKEWHVSALDHRGHGDSAHSPDGRYTMDAYVYDLAQLIHQQGLAPLNIVAHSLGGNIALRYAGLYPENVRRLVAIEGLGDAPAVYAERMKTPIFEQMRDWITEQRGLSSRQPRRYSSIEEAMQRMMQERRIWRGHIQRADARQHGYGVNLHWGRASCLRTCARLCACAQAGRILPHRSPTRPLAPLRNVASCRGGASHLAPSNGL